MGEKQDKLVVKLATIAIPIPAYVRVNETGNIENVDAHIRHIDIARRGLPSASTKAAKLDPSSKTVSTAKVKAALMKTNPELDEKQLKVSWVSNWRRVTTRTGIKYRERIVKVEHPGYRSVNLRVQQEHTGFSLGGEVPSLPDAGTNRFQKVTDQRVDGPAYTIPFKNEKPVNVQGERWLQGKTTPNKKFYRDYPFEGTAPLLTQTLAKKHGVTVESLNAQAKLDYEYGNGRDTYGIPSPELDAWRKQNAIPIVHEPSNEQLQLPGTGANAPSKPMTWYKDSDRGPAGPGVTPLREADVDLPVDPEFHRAVSAELAKRRKQEDEKAQRVSAMLNIFEAEDNNWGVGHPISKAHRAMSDEDLMNEMDGITQSIASLEDRLRGSYYDGEPTIEEARWLVQISNLHAEYNVLADELASRHPDRDAELMNIEVGGNFAPKKPESVKAALWKLLNLRYIDVESGKPVYVEGASRAPILPGLGTSAPKKGAKSDPSVAKALVAKFAPTGQPTDPDIPPYTIGTFKGVKRPSDAVVDVKDERVVKGAGLTLDTDVLDAVMQIVGVNVDEKTKIHIRIIDAHPGETDAEGHQHAQDFGVTQQVGPNEYIVSVRVLSKDNFSDNSLYVINNSLLHEMRHVTQMQHKPGHGADYQKQNATVGYGQNKYELDSRLFGRLADHKGVKDTGDLGPAIGNGLNAFTQSDKYHDGVEPSQAPTGGGLPTINAPEADPEVEQAKLDGTADGEKEVESLIPMTPEERIKTVAQAKINGIKLYNESQAEQDKAKFAQSEYMRRRYKVLRTALKDGEKEKVDALVAESGVDVPEKPSASGGDMLGQVLQILMGGGGPAPVDEEVEAAKVAGDALGAEKIPSLQAMDSDARVKAVADVKIAGIKAAIEAQAKQDHAKFVESESLRRQYKTIRTTLQGDEKEKMDALVEASGLKVPTASKVGGGGAGPDLQALLGGGAPQIDPEVEEAKAKGTIEGEAELPSLQAMEPDERVAEIGQVKIDGLKMATEADTEQDHAKFVQSELLRRKYKAMKEALLEGEKEQMDAWVSKTLSKVPGADEPEDGGLLEIAPNAPKTSRAVASSPWSIAKRSLRQKSAQWEAETWEPQFFGKSSGLTFAQWISNRMDNDGDVNLPDFGAGHFIGRNSGAYAVGHRGVTDTSAGAMKAFALNLMKANPGISIQQVAAAWMDKEVDSEWKKSDSYDSMFWSLVDYLGKLEIQR